MKELQPVPDMTKQSKTNEEIKKIEEIRVDTERNHSKGKKKRKEKGE